MLSGKRKELTDHGYHLVVDENFTVHRVGRNLPARQRLLRLSTGFGKILERNAYPLQYFAWEISLRQDLETCHGLTQTVRNNEQLTHT